VSFVSFVILLQLNLPAIDLSRYLQDSENETDVHLLCNYVINTAFTHAELYYAYICYRGSISGRIRDFFSSPPRPDRLWGPHILLSNGYRCHFPGDKAAGRETDHSSPSTSMAWCLTRHRILLQFGYKPILQTG